MEMLELLKNYPGTLKVNGKEFENVLQAIQAFGEYQGRLVIELNTNIATTAPSIAPIPTPPPWQEVEEGKETEYVIKVKQYMTKPASPSFDFMDKWNNGVPMPMRIMVGKKLKETKGMVKMELRGEIIQDNNPTCMKCGRELTNPVSQYFGIGPECGGHHYISPFETDAELQQAIEETRKQLQSVTWTGWVIKSALEKFEPIRRESID
jgi:hypothetical protein